jgi:phenylalanyl-tRNA synthetase beta chain
VLESAYFEPKGVRRTSKRLGCMTESSRRFERGVDPERVVTALQRVTELICDWAGGTPTEDWIDHYPETITPKHIPLPVKEVERLLGLALDAKTCRAMLTRLGCAVGGSSITLEVSVPTARHDLARIHGYDKIEATLSDFSPQPLHRPDGWDAMAMCLERLRASGFSEAVHYAFVPTSTDQHFPMAGRTPVPMNNPLGHEPNVLKTTLVAGLVESAARNRRHGQESVRLCELRPVFSSQEDGVEEHVALSGIMVGRRHPFGWTQVQDMVDFFDVKGLVEQIVHWMALADWRWESQDPPRFLHPGRAAWIADAHSPIGFCGELHPDVQRLYGLDEATLVFELDWERLVRRQAERHVQFTAMAKHPGIRRDVSLLAESTLASQAVVEAIRATKAPWITEVTLFDCYEGKGMPEGKKSLAYAVQYHDPSRTLTDDEVNAVHERVVEHVVKTLGVDVRK